MLGYRRHPLSRFDRLDGVDSADWNLELEGDVLARRLIGHEFDRERKGLAPLLSSVKSDRTQNRIGVCVKPGPGQHDPVACSELWQLCERLISDDARLHGDGATVGVKLYQLARPRIGFTGRLHGLRAHANGGERQDTEGRDPQKQRGVSWS